MESAEVSHHSEVWRGLQDRIMTPEEFREKFENDTDFRNNIAGCTSLGINHVVKGVAGDKISIRRYDHPIDKNPKVNLIPSKDVFLLLFPDETEIADAFYYEEDFNWIEENRDYGQGWAISELLLQRGISPFEHNPLHEDIHFILLNTPSLNSADSPQDVQTIIEDLPNSDTGSMVSTIEYAQSTLGGISQLANTLHQVKERRGVQIIYGNPTEFTKFIRGGILDRIRGGRYETYDDVTIGLRDDIPDQFILAIVPLGEYEQKLMGKVDTDDSVEAEDL